MRSTLTLSWQRARTTVDFPALNGPVIRSRGKNTRRPTMSWNVNGIHEVRSPPGACSVMRRKWFTIPARGGGPAAPTPRDHDVRVGRVDEEEGQRRPQLPAHRDDVPPGLEDVFLREAVREELHGVHDDAGGPDLADRPGYRLHDVRE